MGARRCPRRPVHVRSRIPGSHRPSQTPPRGTRPSDRTPRRRAGACATQSRAPTHRPTSHPGNSPPDADSAANLHQGRWAPRRRAGLPCTHAGQAATAAPRLISHPGKAPPDAESSARIFARATGHRSGAPAFPVLTRSSRTHAVHVPTPHLWQPSPEACGSAGILSREFRHRARVLAFPVLARGSPRHPVHVSHTTPRSHRPIQTRQRQDSLGHRTPADDTDPPVVPHRCRGSPAASRTVHLGVHAPAATSPCECFT